MAWVGLGPLGLAWFGLVWLGLAWFGFGWLDLSWLGLAWLGLAWLGLAGSIQNKNKSKKDLNSGPEIFELVAQPLTHFGRFCFLLCEGFGRYTCEGFYVALHILVRRFSIGFLFG